MTAPLVADFPNLLTSPFRETSPPTRQYNCIGFAAGETDRWWWPIGAYWPPGVRRDETVEAFIDAFQTLGYSPCDDARLEQGFEKVALYVNPSGKPKHMARQLSNGIWTSKLGGDIDIEHDELIGLAGTEYGAAKYILKRVLR